MNELDELVNDVTLEIVKLQKQLNDALRENIELRKSTETKECYQCGGMAKELSYNSRCMRCMNARDKVNSER